MNILHHFEMTGRCKLVTHSFSFSDEEETTNEPPTTSSPPPQTEEELQEESQAKADVYMEGFNVSFEVFAHLIEYLVYDKIS